MAVPEIAESYTGAVNRVTLGATKEGGGTRSTTVTVGGARNVVYSGSPEESSEKPVVAMDVMDSRSVSMHIIHINGLTLWYEITVIPARAPSVFDAKSAVSKDLPDIYI